MMDDGQSQKRYPSDLTDEQWAIVEPMLPPAKQGARGGRPRTVDMRGPQHDSLSEPEWLPMGYAATRFAAQEYGL
jgi:transposase